VIIVGVMFRISPPSYTMCIRGFFIASRAQRNVSESNLEPGDNSRERRYSLSRNVPTTASDDERLSSHAKWNQKLRMKNLWNLGSLRWKACIVNHCNLTGWWNEMQCIMGWVWTFKGVGVGEGNRNVTITSLPEFLITAPRWQVYKIAFLGVKDNELITTPTSMHTLLQRTLGSG